MGKGTYGSTKGRPPKKKKMLTKKQKTLPKKLQAKIMKSKKNYVAKDLFSKKYKPRIVKPKKGKGSFTRKKK